MSLLTLQDFVGRKTDPVAIQLATEKYEAYIKDVNDSIKARDIVNQDLRAIGITEDFAVFGSTLTPREALPILAKHLAAESIPDDGEMGWLARCFAQKEYTIEYWDLIHEKFQDVTVQGNKPRFKEGLAVALSGICQNIDQISDLCVLFENPMYGDDRLHFVAGWKRSKIPMFQELFERVMEYDETIRQPILSWKSYWKKRNPQILEKYKNS